MNKFIVLVLLACCLSGCVAVLVDDPSESTGLSQSHPDKLNQMVQLWHEYAEQNSVSLEFTP